MVTLSELGQVIRRLTNLAYPTAPRKVRENLAKDQFIDVLIDSDIRIRIKQSRPTNLNEATGPTVSVGLGSSIEELMLMLRFKGRQQDFLYTRVQRLPWCQKAYTSP